MRKTTCILVGLAGGLGLTGQASAILVAHYACDATSGLIAADSVGGRDITYSGTGDPAWMVGKFGNAIHTVYGGSTRAAGDQDRAASAVRGTLISGDFTIVMWLYNDALGPAWMGIIRGTTAAGTRAWDIHCNASAPSDGKWQMVWDDADNPTSHYINLRPNPSFSDGWHHLAIVRRGTTQTVYRDAVQVDQWTVNAGTMAYGDGYVEVNRERSWVGGMDDIGIYNHALTTGEIQSVYSQGVSSGPVKCISESSSYGINAHTPMGAELNPLLSAAQACGLGWIRVDFNWYEVEPSQNSFSWGAHDAIVAAADARGLRIFLTIAYTPAWATSGAPGTGAPNNPADYYDICFRTAQRYPSIRHFGLWNEPNLSAFWTGTRQQYIDIILKNGADAIHAANPNAKVCGPELSHLSSGNWDTWLPDCITQAGDKLDIVTHHVYDGDGNADVTKKLEAPRVWPWDPPSVKQVLQNTGWFGKPFWLTETGWESGKVGEANQANYYTGLLNDWFTGNPSRSWIHKVFPYELNDSTHFPDYSWGILGQDLAFPRKAAYTAYQSFIAAHPAAVALPGWASRPSPSHQATDVSTTVTLSWSAASCVDYYKVYFGSSSPGTFRGNQSNTTYQPGTLSPGTTYYWRIDSVNVSGTTTGYVWSFTTRPPPPGKATNPNPAHQATAVGLNADLSWTAGSGATSHNVYFGTSSPGTYRGNQTAATLDPGALAANTTYYWRIDEVNAGGGTTGDVWSFTTQPPLPGKAMNPNPAHQAAAVGLNADLSWTAGSGATSHNVYFGTSSPGTYRGNQTAATLDPGALAANTTYYWRIDEVNAGGGTTGDVWSFTTQPPLPGKAMNPNPAHQAAAVGLNADLSWTAGSGATSHNVYFGTSSPGTYRGNQTAATLDPGALAANTTYYWRIDEVNAAGTTIGDAWSFTTYLVSADFDDDGDVDGVDYGVFAGCFNGTGNPINPSCSRADLNGDNAVDGIDYGLFASCFNGTGNPPACQ